MTPAAPTATPLTGRHVLALLLGFFAVIFAVNGVFLYAALKTHPGESEAKSYLQGLNYNAVIDARARQAELGWTGEIGLAELAGTRAVEFRLLDASGRGLSGFEVTGEGELRGADARVELLSFESLGDGIYRADASALDAGAWDISISTSDGHAPFTAVKRLRVAP